MAELIRRRWEPAWRGACPVGAAPDRPTTKVGQEESKDAQG
jgi:hypothetical protein